MGVYKARWIVPVLCVIATACGDTGTEVLVPSTITVASGGNQSAAAGAAVAVNPTVRVTDASGKAVSNVVVTFQVSGGGTITQPVDTTDADGVASPGTWKLGQTTGQNTITAHVAGVADVTISATSTAGAASTVVSTGGNTQTATAGSALTLPLAVQVKDQFGNPVQGVVVTFAAATGGGSVGSASVTTDAQGTAQTTATLGNVAGANSFTATVAGLPVVTFTATGSVGPAAALTITAGDAQTALARTTVTTRPAVRVADARGNAVRNATVTFRVASGGGTIVDSVQVSDSTGVARLGSWTLGTAGPNTITATTAGAQPVTFTATATDPCLSRQTLTVGGPSLTGTLTSADCTVNNLVRDSIDIVVPANTAAFNVTLAPSNLKSAFALAGILWGMDDAATAFTARYILPNGSYKSLVRPVSAGVTGVNYSISATPASAEASGCITPTTVKGVSIQQTGGPDCPSQITQGTLYDGFLVSMTAGTTYTITVTSTQAKRIEIFGPGFGQLAANSGTPAATATVAFTPTVSGIYEVDVLATSAATANGYTIGIQ